MHDQYFQLGIEFSSNTKFVLGTFQEQKNFSAADHKIRFLPADEDNEDNEDNASGKEGTKMQCALSSPQA